MQGRAERRPQAPRSPRLLQEGTFQERQAERGKKVVQDTSATACLRLISGSCEQKRSFRPGSLSSSSFLVFS